MRRRSRIDPLDVVLGEVPAEHADEAARSVHDDGRLRAEVERLAPVVARLERLPAEAWTPPPAPPLEVGAPVPPPRSAWRRRGFVLRPAAAIVAAAALVIAGVAGGVVMLGEDGGAGPARADAVPLLPLDRSVPGGAARGGETGRAVVGRDGRVRVDVRGVVPDRAGAYHELWLLPAAGDPVPVGRFRVERDGHGVATFRLPAEAGRFAYFDVSEEPADGDPAHSGRSILRAPV